MVRIHVPDLGDVTPPLYLFMLSDDQLPIVRLRVDKAEYWTLENVTVLSTPDGSLVGAPFPHIYEAMGSLKRFLPRQTGSHNYVEQLYVYVDERRHGRLDESKLGVREIRFKLYGESVSTRHSPDLAVAPVQCLAAEPADKVGRWLPVSVLRPFVPPTLRDDEANAKVRELMSQGKHVPWVREAFRRAPPPTRDVDAQPAVGTKRALPPLSLPPGFERAADMLSRRVGGDDDVSGTSSSGGGGGRAGGSSGGDDCSRGESCTADNVGAASCSAAATTATRTVARPPAGRSREREKWFDKKGNVVVPVHSGAMEASKWPVCLVIVGKRHGPPLGGSNSPRYVEVEVLPPAQDEDLPKKPAWHISELEPLRDAAPRAWRMMLDDACDQQGGRPRMALATVYGVRKQHERQSHSKSLEESWDSLVPEAVGRWRQVEAWAAAFGQ